MRIGIRAHDVAYAPLNELIPNIHNQGFHCMHIALSKTIKEFKPGEETMTPGLAMYIKELCAENKVDIAVLGCYLNLCNPNEEKHKEIVEKYKAHIRFASILGCGVVGTETGAVNEEYKYEPANHSEEALQCFIDNLRPIVKYAEQFGVIVAIEPVWKHIVNTVERARKVLDAIDSPNLQIILDPVNLLDESNYQEYLMKNFGFRKAYCKLQIEYRPLMQIAVNVLYPLRGMIKKVNIKWIYTVWCALHLEEIRRTF